MVAAVKAQNKISKKRELSRIRRMPSENRAKARAELQERLKAREKAVNEKLPSKVDSPSHLQTLMSSSRVLKV